DAIEQLTWLFLPERDDFVAGFRSLVQAVTTDLDWVRMHTYLLQRAVEWQKNGHERSLLLQGHMLRRAETWQAGATEGKQPPPTPLHAQYILASRRAQSLRARLTVGVLAIGLLLALGLAVF